MKKENVPTTPQYCRYCGNCNQCDEDIIYCEQKEKTFSKEYACRLNIGTEVIGDTNKEQIK